MKRITTLMTPTILLVLCIAAPAALGSQKKPAPSAEHKAAVAKCNTDYKAAQKAANTKKGQERKDALAAAKKAHTECLAAAPQ